ncbi:lysozyme inhibitor LprI family protein, partial [Methylorubrum rhodesianum]|uniref:lysozyme inhibitor LprI family protein n=1 Tax=Methylorubrum rhodesianum TaxID=29427 RepID=UPI003D01F999
MSRLFAAAVLGAYVGMLVTMTFTPQAMAAPERPTPETCSMDDPTACLDRHGEAAARALDKAYADAASKLSAACAEVISPGIGACLERAWQIADKELNETYARAMKSIENDEAGRKWREQLKLELCGRLGDDGVLKAAYRGGCRSLPEPLSESDT